MKKVIGLINLFFGILEILIGIPYILFTIPKLLEMYSSMGVELPYNPSTAYFAPIFIVLLGLLNLLTGLGNFNVIFRNKPNLVYKVGMFLAVLSFIMTGLVVSSMVNGMINPIYSLSGAISN